MTITLELKPDLGAHLKNLAQACGLSLEAYLSTLIEKTVPNERSKAAIALLEAWDEEDATDDPEELAKRRSEWDTMKASMNENHTSDRILFS